MTGLYPGQMAAFHALPSGLSRTALSISLRLTGSKLAFLTDSTTACIVHAFQVRYASLALASIMLLL